MRQEYGKLVRDRIPEIIRQDGRQCDIEIMPKEEYIQGLKDKLIEEAQEAAVAKSEELIKELADLYEVIDSLMMVCGIDRKVVLVEQEKRRQKRGGFGQRVRLLWTD